VLTPATIRKPAETTGRKHGNLQVERYTFATTVLRLSAIDAVELPTACDPFTIGRRQRLSARARRKEEP
jgi:hypothetical protein